MDSHLPNRDDHPTPPEQSTVILLLKSIGDTTWRMFVPTIGGTLLGVWLDSVLGTAPWLVVAGIVAGVVVTALLIVDQFKKLT